MNESTQIYLMEYHTATENDICVATKMGLPEIKTCYKEFHTPCPIKKKHFLTGKMTGKMLAGLLICFCVFTCFGYI